MAQVPMVTAVHRDDLGDVVEVMMGIADTQTNAWVPGREPSAAPVINVVDALMAGDLVCTRMPNGTSGPGLRVVLANRGGGRETIQTDDPARPIDQFEQY